MMLVAFVPHQSRSVPDGSGIDSMISSLYRCLYRVPLLLTLDVAKRTHSVWNLRYRDDRLVMTAQLRSRFADDIVPVGVN